ncbi:CYTH domain-containing protein [Amycolatopsis methanolica]|uniref:CYTH domain-containing protein n=1 Tax=Amycolatopsis methanolica TaxID=1814 RepID=UPI0034369814
MRRYIYYITPGDQSKWIRLRDTGSETTLCVKEIRSDAIDGTHEVEVTVGDFADTNELLGLLGFTPKSYQENRRTSFRLDGVRLGIDEWPVIPSTWRMWLTPVVTPSAQPPYSGSPRNS